MSIERIDPELCNGCGICVDSCCKDVLRMDEKGKKAIIKYPDDCMLRTICEIECPQNAIYVSPKKCMPAATAWRQVASNDQGQSANGVSFGICEEFPISS